MRTSRATSDNTQTLHAVSNGCQRQSISVLSKKPLITNQLFARSGRSREVTNLASGSARRRMRSKDSLASLVDADCLPASAMYL